MLQDVVPLGDLLTLACALGAVALGALALREARRVSALPAACLQRLQAAEIEGEKLRSEWRREKNELASWTEEADGILQAVETKRRRIAAGVSKVNAQQAAENGADGDPNSPEYWQRRVARGGRL